jgi:DNA-binding winged helix-turn-helix (wHTH) protein
MEATHRTRRTRFGAFDVDLRSGEVHKHGIRLKLQDQPFQVLSLLLEHPGDVVTREELRQKLWPGDTFVDFDTGLNSAVRKLRDVLGDSADEPRYIETLPRRGYRFIAHVENGHSPAPALVEVHLDPVLDSRPTPKPSNKRRVFVAAGAGAFILVAVLVRGESISLGLCSLELTSSSSRTSSTRQVIRSSTARWTKHSK